MKNDLKKLVTDIGRGENLDENLKRYLSSVNEQYNYYATVKLSMNYYTLSEMLSEDEVSEDVKTYVDTIKSILLRYVIADSDGQAEDIDSIDGIRRRIEAKMQILTAIADGYEIYEYILNRVEAGIKNTAAEVDVDKLVARTYNYIFSENDSVVINSKLQLVMAQLPVRMTKNKFYDVVTNTLSIYKGGDKKAVNDFVDMLRKTIQLTIPDGFDSEYSKLYELYESLRQTDYKAIDEAAYDSLTKELADAAAFIENESTLLVLLQEIVNDTYAILLSNHIKAVNCGKPGYKAAVDIIKACTGKDKPDMMSDSVMASFMSIEGVQEDILESVLILETARESMLTSKADSIVELGLTEAFKKLDKLDKLLSTSLFASLDEASCGEDETADNDYIMQLREDFVSDLSKLFENNKMVVNRSIMCKLLSVMPIFLNTTKEIKEYLEYALANCRDDSELTACSRLLDEIIEEV